MSRAPLNKALYGAVHMTGTALTRRFLPAAILMSASVILTGCLSDPAHKNFMNTMQQNVGKSADDPYVVFNRYAVNRGTLKTLPNGNTEQEWVYRKVCQVFFEIDRTSRKIIAWRFEGSPQTCTIPL